MTLTLIFTAIKGALGSLAKSKWFWIILSFIVVLFFVDRRARGIQKAEDAKIYTALIDSMKAHPDTVWIKVPVTLPKPKEPKPIEGTPLPIPPEVDKELADLRQSKLEGEAKIAAYELAIRIRSTPWISKYEDSVQTLDMLINPVRRTVTPSINYKTPWVWTPVITNTAWQKPAPWWRSDEAKIIYGIVGAGFVYSAIDGSKEERLWRSMVGTGMLTLSFGL
jgi:hypothetical protein